MNSGNSEIGHIEGNTTVLSILERLSSFNRERKKARVSERERERGKFIAIAIYINSGTCEQT